MPNYRYQTADYNRRRNYRPGPCQTPAGSAADSCPVCPVGRADADKLQGMEIAMTYVPWQTWTDLYDAEKGFSRGTIFEELDKPFQGTGGCQNAR